MQYDGIPVTILGGKMEQGEIDYYVSEERQLWKQKGQELASITLTIDGDEVEIKGVEKSNISRIRRITGYLSKEDNFNLSKAAELKARVKHV